MRKYLLLLTLFWGAARAATGDISARVIQADGWTALLTIDGFTLGATYAFGYGANNEPSANTPYFTVVSKGYDSAGSATTTTRTVYCTKVVRFPAGTAYISGSFTSGTFVDGETVTQATSGATGIIVGNQSSGTRLVFRGVTGTFNNSAVVTGGTSGATFTSSSTLTNYTNGTNHELATSTGLVVRVALSDYVFQKDNSGGGNSGTAPTFTAPASFVTNSGGASQTSAAASAVSVTNSSTQAYRMPLFQWDHIAGVCHADRVSSDFYMAGNANALFGIAAIRFDATGATSSNNVNATVTTQTPVFRSATGLYANAYRTQISTSGFTTGELINLRARVYPVVGDSTEVLDTDSYTTVTDECLGYTKPIIVFNSTIKYAYVDPSRGTDTGSVASTTQATAQASPFWSIGKAIQNDATVIYLMAGTHPAVRTTSTTRRTTNEWYVVQPAPGETAATVTYQVGTTKEYRCQRLRIEGVKVTLASTSSWMDGESADNNLRFTNCVFDGSGVGSPTTNVGYQSNSTKFENCTGDLSVTEWSLQNFSTARVNFQFDGCVFTESSATSNAIQPWYRIVACYSTNNTCFGETSTSNVSPAQDNFFVENNKITYSNTANYGISIASARNVSTGGSIRGNIIEQLVGGQPFFFIAADSSTTTCNGILFENNTLAGGRFNCGYNDAGSTSYDRKFWGIKNNLLESWATKHDTFTTANGARTGAWAVLYGVGASGNFSPHCASIGASGSFMFEWMGLRSYQPAATGQPPGGSTNVIGYVQFINRQAYTGSTGAGGGNYALSASSPAHNLQYLLRMPYDLNGRARLATDDPGAIAFPVGGTYRNWFLLTL